MSEGLGGNIGCRDKTSSWYQKCITFVHVIATAAVPVALYQVLKHGGCVETVCSVLKYIRDWFIFY